MKNNSNIQNRLTLIILKLLLVLFLISFIGMSFIYYKVSSLLIHRKNTKHVEVFLDSKKSSYEEVTFKSKKGNVTLKGAFFAAKPISNKTLIVVHGFGENRFMSGRTEILVKHLIPQGYNILAFDLRGHGKSEGDLISFGYYEKYDVLGAINYLKKRGKEGEEIALLGFSMGAVAAIEATGEDKRVNAVIADSAIRDLRLYILNDLNSLSDDLNSILDNLGVAPYYSIFRYFPFKNNAILGVAKLYHLNVDEVSPMNTVKNISKKPIFLIHSKNDRFIPYTNSEAIFKSISDKSNVEFWTTAKAGHIGSLKMYPEAYLRKIKTFLDENM